ncbi:hypothetical protein DRI96_04175 [Candidatus Aerophobetes bacterium]|uniref:Uncharacterized protein n=1 Tax=Aerophobetes bacterium TaxID=2030807 RepID=A0A662DB14_UNCAE|nr:MAG: hypothetical protein DRI96_04175 [Candidatus Aerophobetes bacterium]
MILTIYYRKEDEWLLKKIDEICVKERKSKSAVILSILEQYFEQGKKIGEILQDMGLITPEQLREALELQKKEKRKMLGQILKEREIIDERHIQKAIALQMR